MLSQVFGEERLLVRVPDQGPDQESRTHKSPVRQPSRTIGKSVLWTQSWPGKAPCPVSPSARVFSLAEE